MSLPSKPYDNKKHYDVGRMRQKIEFWQDVVTDNPSGGSVVVPTLLLSTWAGKEEVSLYTQGQFQAGQTQYNKMQYFVIRNRKNFFPVKDMTIVHGSDRYTIMDVKLLDDPCTFLKIICQVAV